MTKKIFYEKIGRRYKPVSEHDSDLHYALPMGTHIIMSHPGGQSTRYNIDPAYGPMIAAGRFAGDAISQTIMDKSALRSKEDRKPLTPEQLAAWNALKEAFGDEMFPLEYCSYREAADAGVQAMMIEAEKMLENPSVRKAWNNFMLVWQLTKSSENESKV